MESSSSRTVEPLSIEESDSFNDEELTAVFMDAANAVLFWKIFGPKWPTTPISEQLQLKSQVAVLCEQAAHLNPQATEPELKES